MKTFTRRWIGAVAFGVSVLCALVISWSGAWRGPVLESHTHSYGSVTATSAVYEAHWPLWIRIVLLGAAGLGIFLLLIPGRQKTNA
jgi:hypothetical protein